MESSEVKQKTIAEFENVLENVETACMMIDGIHLSLSDKALRASTYIFTTVLMDKMYSLQKSENMDFKTRCKMSEKCGEELRKLVKTYTNIDTWELHEK